MSKWEKTLTLALELRQNPVPLFCGSHIGASEGGEFSKNRAPSPPPLTLSLSANAGLYRESPIRLELSFPTHHSILEV
ncbi:hypothetical protein RRG08_018212 [Elysia crispata]|uniref:Uncharacterized protein n=1 Tax=Elysia crispata TaxID=231223 RepID=A0AAE1D0M9_9GAST|nr:hypothetical protein RRG08_018212 [Elysia crispata]